MSVENTIDDGWFGVANGFPASAVGVPSALMLKPRIDPPPAELVVTYHVLPEGSTHTPLMPPLPVCRPH
jgi:hypothetical protein